MKQTDQKLTDKIRQVFDDFEDLRADEGWQELRKKYPHNNRKVIFIWLGSVAALLLIATGLWFFKAGNISNNQTALKNFPGDKTKTTESKKATELSGSPEKEEKNKNYPSGESYVQNSKILKPANNKSASENTGLLTSSKHITEIIKTTLPVKSVSPIPGTTELTAENPAAIKDSLPVAIANIPTPVTFKNPKVSHLPVAKNLPVNAQKKESKNTSFSIYAGSYFNYAEGSENQLNFGAGFISDIRLSKNLKLSTGLSIASNSLSYSHGLPQSAINSLSSPLQINSGNASIFSTIISYNAQLLALDIPVNIKYQFVPESDKFYVSAGLISGTYLTETYAYQYQTFNSSSGSYNQTQDQKIKKQLNDFDLGRTLNLSFGLSTRFGKTQTISIEPFLKYPLGGLGTENLKFGSTGINLKLHFKTN